MTDQQPTANSQQGTPNSQVNGNNTATATAAAAGVWFAVEPVASCQLPVASDRREHRP